MRGKKLETAELRLSIHQNIRLILKTFSLSYRFDPTFGCILNKYQAATPPQRKSERTWREKMREDVQKNLKDLLQRYETRIKVTDVIVDMHDPGRDDNSTTVNVKVDVFGHLTLEGQEHFHFPDSEITEEAMELFPLYVPVGKK